MIAFYTNSLGTSRVLINPNTSKVSASIRKVSNEVIFYMASYGKHNSKGMLEIHMIDSEFEALYRRYQEVRNKEP